MELVCNELSFFPLADDSHTAEQRFRNVLQVFKEARQKYGFTHIRFPVNHSTQKITSTQTLFEWLPTVASHTLRSLIVGIFRPPYIDDLEENEMKLFVENKYAIHEAALPINNAPFGLPIAYIKAVPAISFDSHTFWRSRRIQVKKAGVNGAEDSFFYVYNICQSDDMNSQELDEWRENSFPQLLATETHLKNYLGYAKYKSIFTTDFLAQFYNWKKDDFDAFKYILLLMKDVEAHPFTGGMGQTENLKNRGKEASKRINIIDRLSYSIANDAVTFIACKGHYEFHD